MPLTLHKPNNPSTFTGDSLDFECGSSEPISPEARVTVIIGEEEFSPSEINIGKNSVTGIFSLKEFIPKAEAEKKDYIFKIKIASELSNEALFTVAPRESWNKPLGGFFSPQGRQVGEEFLIIEGWAAKLGTSIKSVTVQLLDSSYQCKLINIWSPYVGRTLPSIPEAMNASFSVAVSGKEFFRGWKSFLPTIPLFVSGRIVFNDGTRHNIRGPKLIWKKRARPKIARKSSGGSKILFIANNLRSTEGAPKVLNELIQLCSSLPNNELHLISPADGELREALESRNVSVNILEDLYLAHYSRDDDFKRQTGSARALIESIKPDLIFGNTTESFWAISHGIKNNIPAAWLIHESIDPYLAFPELGAAGRLEFLSALKNCDKLLFVSHSTYGLFSKINADAEVIPNAVSLSAKLSGDRTQAKLQAKRFISAPADKLLILCVGTVCKRKGQDVLVSALNNLNQDNWFALLVGARESPYLVELKKQIQILGLTDKIALIEETSDVDKYYQAADIFVIPSREESAPLVSLEALSWQLPIVSTDAFGLKEQLEGSKAAILVPSEAPGPLTAALAKLLSEEKLREDFSSAANHWVQSKFSYTQMKNSYLSVLQKLLGIVGCC